jgi:hypothetical protein
MKYWKAAGKILAIIFVPGVMTAAAVWYLAKFFRLIGKKIKDFFKRPAS